MKELFSFLTRVPTKSKDLEIAAKHAYLFPLIGLIIGLMAYAVGYFSFTLLPNEIGASITTLSIYSVTGLVHLDGLSDFSDGIMASGDRERKFSAMKDAKIGVAGIFSIVFILLITVYSISVLGNIKNCRSLTNELLMYQLGCALIISEISAKLSMNTCIALGKRMPDGIGSIFIQRSTWNKYIIAFAISTLIGLIVARSYFIVVYVGIVVSFIVVKIAHKNFGAVNGDAIGASNEIARAATLLVWVVIIWI